MDPYHQYALRPHPLSPFEMINQSAANDLGDLGYGKHKDEVEDELKRLFAWYATPVLFGGRHRAPCSVWRSERLLINEPKFSRFANRVHVFQKKVQREEGANENSAYGQYLGFVSLRPQVRSETRRGYGFVYTAVAYITPPRYMLRPRYHVLTTASGSPEGVLPFRATPFCFPNEDTDHRASCLHSALQSALLLKMNSLGCAPITGQEMVAYLWTKKNEESDLKDPGAGPISQEELSKAGASLEDALMLLGDKQIHAGGVLESIVVSEFKHEAFVAGYKIKAEELVKLEAHRCWTDYLANGLPLIVALKPVQTGKFRRGHSVLLVGMHLLHDPEDYRYEGLKQLTEAGQNGSPQPGWRVDLAELPGRFVVHDINDRPFAEREAFELLQNAWIADDEEGRSGISFLALAPQGTHVGIHDVRLMAKNRMLGEDVALWTRYCRDHELDADPKFRPPEQEDDMRFITRLLQSGQVLQRFFAPGTVEGRAETRVPPSPGVMKLLQEAGLGQERYWWAVEVRYPHAIAPQRTLPSPLVLLWKTSVDRKAAPQIIIRYARKSAAQDRTFMQVQTVPDMKTKEYPYEPSRA